MLRNVVGNRRMSLRHHAKLALRDVFGAKTYRTFMAQ